jgi:hypothetical protein
MELFKKLFSTLNQERVKYMVAGGIAVNLYGIERATADLDIVVLLEDINLMKFISVAKQLGLKPKNPVQMEDFLDPHKRRTWVTEKNMKVFSLFDPKNPFFLIDVFTEVPFDFGDVYGRRKKIRFEKTSIPLVPLDALIEMKRGTGRPQDETDIFYLERIKKDFTNEE